MDGGLPAGVYESLHTRNLDRLLAGTPNLTPRFSPVADADAPEVLGRHVATVVRRLLLDERDPGRRTAIILELLNAVGATDDLPTAVLEQLLVLTR